MKRYLEPGSECIYRTQNTQIRKQQRWWYKKVTHSNEWLLRKFIYMQWFAVRTSETSTKDPVSDSRGCSEGLYKLYLGAWRGSTFQRPFSFLVETTRIFFQGKTLLVWPGILSVNKMLRTVERNEVNKNSWIPSWGIAQNLSRRQFS